MKNQERKKTKATLLNWFKNHLITILMAFSASLFFSTLLLLTGCTTPGQYAANVYCNMTEEERQNARERLEVHCNEG